jgi:hypothetical protein
MIRTKGEAGTGNVVEAVRHIKTMNREIAELSAANLEEKAKEYRVPVELVKEVMDLGRPPFENFALVNQAFGNSFVQSRIYTPPKMPSASICFGERSGLKSG